MMKLEGKFMTVGVRNSNGRLYNSSAFATAFEEYKKKVDAGEAYGRIMDIEHPERSFENNISDISHRVTEVRWNTENGEITGKLELLDTPNGKLLQEFVKQTGSLYISPSMIVDNTNTVNGEIKHIERLESFDVCQESAWPDAKVKPTTTK